LSAPSAGRAAEPRGIRNHNPGNIEHRPENRWQGLAEPPSDGRFCRFVSAPYGIRALARVLITYQDRHGLASIEALLGRWAPPGENDTAAYAEAVARALDRAPGEPVDVHRHDVLRPLVEAIIRHENGVQPYDDATLVKGLVLAGVEPPAAPLGRTGTMQGAKVAGAATIAAMSMEITQFGAAATQLSTAARTLADLGPLVLGAISLLAIGYIVWRRIEDRRRGLR